MPIVTLTTDWIQDDYYVGAIKGKLISLSPDISIIDISHSIQPFNTAKAAFIIKNSYTHFPKGTIHLIFVNTEPAAGESLLAIKYEDHFFIGNDNGIFGLIFRDQPTSIVELPEAEAEKHGGFSALDIFVRATGQIVKDGDLINAGKQKDNFSKSIPRRATIDQDVINGSVIYIDSYKNAITNITKDLFNRIGKGRQFEIALQSNHYRLTRINKTYGETSVGELLVLFNSLDLLEVAINKGNATGLLNLTNSSTIRIRFFDKPLKK